MGRQVELIRRIRTLTVYLKTVFFSSDIEVSTIGSGVIIRSPNGTRYRITVDNAGALITTAIT